MVGKKKNKQVVLFGSEILICVLLCIFAVITFVIFTDLVLGNKFEVIDSKIQNFFLQNETSFLTKFMFFISGFGSMIFFFTLSVVFAGYLYIRKKADAFIFIAIIYSAVVINIFLKFFYERPRPDLNPLVIENSYSYPSFHAMGSMVLYFSIAYFIYRETKSKSLTVILSSLFTLLVLLIGISSIYLGVHFPSDVIAGFLSGFIWIMVIVIFQRTIVFENLYNKAIRRKNGSK